jgi:phosphoribosylglycinamide formyltransferase 2
VIIEGFVKFVSEITLLTLRTVNGTQFCDAIGHLQVDGDYIESWQPHALSALQLQRSQAIASSITERLGGYGIFGVELFLLEDDQVLFSEVSPRPHDTGLVTMATQVLSEFALHARAILGLPVASIERHSCGASAAVKATTACASPVFHGLTKVLAVPGVDVRLFGKPEATAGRRMGVVTATAESVDAARAKAVAGRAALSMQST